MPEDYNEVRRKNHPVTVVPPWPKQVTKAPLPIPNKTSKTSPAKK
jgi:hypothetical protein